MPTQKKLKARALPDNPFFMKNVSEIRWQLGLPDNGVPQHLVNLCSEWLARRGPHPSGGYWGQGEYWKRANNETQWKQEIVSLSPKKHDEMKAWLRGIIYGFKLPKQLQSAIKRFVIDNDSDALRSACDAVQDISVNVDWHMDKGTVITIEGVESSLSKNDWGKLFQRVKPLIPDRPMFGENSEQARERQNFERDLFFFLRYREGVPYESLPAEWNKIHPTPESDPNLATIEQAVERMVDLMMPDNKHISGDYEEVRRWLKRPISESKKNNN